MPILHPLRSTIIGLGLCAAATSAQAALTMTFLEDPTKGHLSIIFSGMGTTPVDITRANEFGEARFGTDFAYIATPEVEQDYYDAFRTDQWTYANPLPLTNSYSDPVFTNGTGGFYYGDYFMVMSTGLADAGEEIYWSGIITYAGDLAGLGLEEGDFGTLVFTHASGTLLINWETAVVPEPTTYALALGLGVAGVALLRRRTRS